MINAFMQAVNGKLSCCCIVTALNTYTSVESLPLAKNALHCTSNWRAGASRPNGAIFLIYPALMYAVMFYVILNKRKLH